ncbi:uncharacterized protein LOC117641527 isoform X2 [Thrips palmi]|uniref:Uncharacterized protein LOC117641527 isoform X2 n=1 Tax=Thrips palmi TaxID=161013 RepID=A0A6P8YLH2_THRPL|nr:uncharacterized protein LOC117641527 isoform X2 [Thrips palmi]
MSKKGKEADSSPTRLEESKLKMEEIIQQMLEAKFQEMSREFEEKQKRAEREHEERQRRLDEEFNQRVLEGVNQRVAEEVKLRLEEELSRRGEEELSRIGEEKLSQREQEAPKKETSKNSTVPKAPSQQVSKPTGKESASKAAASRSSCHTETVVVCNQNKGDTKSSKSGRRSLKTSGSEDDEQTRMGDKKSASKAAASGSSCRTENVVVCNQNKGDPKSSRSRRRSVKTSGSEDDEQIRKAGANAVTAPRSVKSSEDEGEQIPSIKGGLKVNFNFNHKSLSSIDTKHSKSYSDEGKRLRRVNSSKIIPATSFSLTEKAPADVPVKNKALIQSPLKKSEGPSKLEDGTEPAPIVAPLAQSADFQEKETKSGIEYPIKKSKKPPKMENSSEASPIALTPMAQESSADFQQTARDTESPIKKLKRTSKIEDSTKTAPTTKSGPTQENSADFLVKEAASDNEFPVKKSRRPSQVEDSTKNSEELKALSRGVGSTNHLVKNLKGTTPQNTRKYSRKLTKEDSVVKLKEGHGHQLTKDESNISADNHHNLEQHFDNLTDSASLMGSRPQHALDETHQKDLEHNFIAEIEEQGKTNATALKRKFADLEHNSLLKKRVVKDKENCVTLVKPEVSVQDHSDVVFKEVKVMVKRLSPELIGKLSPPKVSTKEQDNQLSFRDTSSVSNTFKIPSTEHFIKPAIPKKNASLKKRVAANVKSCNVAKRTGKPLKMSKPIEPRVEKNPIKSSESYGQLSDTLFDWHAQKKYVNPMEKLRMEEELDYEPGTGDDDDAMSLYADSTIFQNEDETEDRLVKQARDCDKDSVASCGSDDSRRLSDMEVDSDDDDRTIPADDSSMLEKHIPAPLSPKESVIGIPVEVYPSCKPIESKRDSVESGELVGDDDTELISSPRTDPFESDKMAKNHTSEKYDSSSHDLLKTKSVKCSKKKVNERGPLVSPQRASDKEGTGNLMCVKDDMKGENRRQRSLKMTTRTELSKLSSSTSTSGSPVQVPHGSAVSQLAGVKCKTRQEKISNVQVSSSSKARKTSSSVPAKINNPSISTGTVDQRYSGNNTIQQGALLNAPTVTTREGPETCRTAIQETNKISNLQLSHKPLECDVGDDKLIMEFPGVYFEPPKKVLPTPPYHSTGLLKTPDSSPSFAVPSTSTAMPLQQDTQNLPDFPEFCLPSSLGAQAVPAPILTAKSPLDLVNQTSENQQTMRPNGAIAPISDPKQSIFAASTSNESSPGIHPIHDQGHHLQMSLKDVDLRQNACPIPLQSPKVADDPIVDPLIGNYCPNHLDHGTCNADGCLKIHKFPELNLNDGNVKGESIKLIGKMLIHPYWRENCFSSTVEMLGNYCERIALEHIADDFWGICCDNYKKMIKPDFNCWKQLARAFSLCGLKPSFCTRTILKVLLHRKKNLLREHYVVIDSIVDKLFEDFIKDESDLWFCLKILATIPYYEIPANVMREILRDILKESRDIASHTEVCDYLLRSPIIEQPRKPEEFQLLHYIHQLLFVLQQYEVTSQRAQKLADHFKIPLKNDCCVKYAEKIKSSAGPTTGFHTPRFTLVASSALSSVSHSNQHDTLQPREDNAVLGLASHGPCSSVQNLQNGRNSQDIGAAQSSGESNLNIMEGELQPEFVQSSLLQANDQVVRNLEATFETIKVTTGTNFNLNNHGTLAPVHMSPALEQAASPLKLKIVVNTETEKRKIMEPQPFNENEEPNPSPVKISNPSRSVPQPSPLIDHIKQNKCGKAAKYIIRWTKYPDNTTRIKCVTDTLLSLPSNESKTKFKSILQAIEAQTPKKLFDQLKPIMIPVGLSMLEEFLQRDHFTEANEVHEVLWKKLDPLSVKLDKHSSSYLNLITAWVCVKNDKVKEALDIVISNCFYGFPQNWSIDSKPSDGKLRDSVCSTIFNHCKKLEEHVLDAENLFRKMLEYKESYEIDVTKFFDDILRALVKSAQTSQVLSLLVWAYNEHNLKPYRLETNRLIFTYISTLPNNTACTPEMLHILQQEPYNEAVPLSIEGCPRIIIYLHSVWNVYEVHNIFTFLLNCHLCNVREIPQIAVEIKECQLPTRAPEEFLFPDNLASIDPSVPAMQERVLKVLSKLPIQIKSGFVHGVAELDSLSVRGYVSKRRGVQEGQRSDIQYPGQSSFRDEPTTFPGRRFSDAHPHRSHQHSHVSNSGHWTVPNPPSAPYEGNQWSGSNSEMPFNARYSVPSDYGWARPRHPNVEYSQYGLGSFRGQYNRGRFHPHRQPRQH